MTGSVPFSGFPDGDDLNIALPAGFFETYLASVEDADSLKLVLIMLFATSHNQSEYALFSVDGFYNSDKVQQIFNMDKKRILLALQKSVDIGSLLVLTNPEDDKVYYLLNTLSNRYMVSSIQSGKNTLTEVNAQEVMIFAERKNIFRLYEENIGIITPMMAEILKEDEKEYPAIWIIDAIQIAVERNKRNWSYVRGILKKWKKEGRDGKDRKNPQINRDLYREKWLGQEDGNG